MCTSSGNGNTSHAPFIFLNRLRVKLGEKNYKQRPSVQNLHFRATDTWLFLQLFCRDTCTQFHLVISHSTELSASRWPPYRLAPFRLFSSGSICRVNVSGPGAVSPGCHGSSLVSPIPVKRGITDPFPAVQIAPQCFAEKNNKAFFTRLCSASFSSLAVLSPCLTFFFFSISSLLCSFHWAQFFSHRWLKTHYSCVYVCGFSSGSLVSSCSPM